MYRTVKLVAVTFRLDSVLLTEGNILDPVMRSGSNFSNHYRGPRLWSWVGGGWGWGVGLTFLQHHCFCIQCIDNMWQQQNCLPEI